MNRENALELLLSDSSHARLRAARFFADHALPDDRGILVTALQKESVDWIRKALSNALKRTSITISSPVNDVDKDLVEEAPPELVAEIYARSLSETTKLLIHEIEPILGMLRLNASEEVTNYESSNTKQGLENLYALLKAIRLLRLATKSPANEQFDASNLIHDIIERESQNHSTQINHVGPSPFLIVSDRALLSIILSNGLRNAFEATEVLSENAREPVTITWGVTDKDFWFSIIDHGIGLSSSPNNAFEIGKSTKQDHQGMGLPAAKQATKSLGGEVTLSPRTPTGAHFELRIPKLSDETQ